MSGIVQILITKVEQPTDTPQGEVFKVTVFDNKVTLDSWHFADIDDALGEVKNQMEDLVAL